MLGSVRGEGRERSRQSGSGFTKVGRNGREFRDEGKNNRNNSSRSIADEKGVGK